MAPLWPSIKWSKCRRSSSNTSNSSNSSSSHINSRQIPHRSPTNRDTWNWCSPRWKTNGVCTPPKMDGSITASKSQSNWIRIKVGMWWMVLRRNLALQRIRFIRCYWDNHFWVTVTISERGREGKGYSTTALFPSMILFYFNSVATSTGRATKAQDRRFQMVPNVHCGVAKVEKNIRSFLHFSVDKNAIQEY